MFKAILGHSDDPDSEGAVEEIIEQCKRDLGEKKPKAGLLFSAIDYSFQTLLDGFNDEWPDIELIGCTTDGEISSRMGFCEDSCVLMLFCSDTIDIYAGIGKNLSTDINKATADAVEMAKAKSTNHPALCITIPDGLTCSGQVVVEGLVSKLGADVPLIGGTAGDQLNFEKTFQFFGREVLHDSVPILVFSGPLQVSFSLGMGCKPIGGEGVVTKSSGTLLQEIDSKPAKSFYQQSLGEDTSLSVEIPLAVLNEDGEIDYLRTPSAQFDEKTGEVQMFADTHVGSHVKMVMLDRDNLVDSCEDSAAVAKEHLLETTTPDVILHFSCCGRKVLLGSRTQEEHEKVLSALDTDIPSVGFYTYGEICPSVDQSLGARFHNHTSVVALLGEIND